MSGIISEESVLPTDTTILNTGVMLVVAIHNMSVLVHYTIVKNANHRSHVVKLN